MLSTTLYTENGGYPPIPNEDIPALSASPLKWLEKVYRLRRPAKLTSSAYEVNFIKRGENKRLSPR